MGVEDYLDLIKEISKDEEQIEIFLQVLGIYILANNEIDSYSISFLGKVPNHDIETHCRFKFKFMDENK